MSEILNRLSQAALRHRAGIRRLVPKALHHAVGTLARALIRSAESGDERLRAIEGSPESLAFPAPILPARDFAPDRLIMVNDALASGGAERQIVNTLAAFKARGANEAALLCFRLGEDPELDFFRPELEAAGVEVENVGAQVALDPAAALRAREWLEVEALFLPRDVRDRILRLVAEFVRRRPGIVHGWQDETALVAAFAALLAGVPAIVVATRNVNPSGFGYHRPFMRAAYRVLARRPEVRFVNNSRAGARDYEDWIGLAPGRFAVVHNGVDLSAAHASRGDRDVARSELAIPAAAQVVGSVIRFNAEKRPLLWIDVAARVLRRFPDAHFLIAGDGPMRAAAAAHGKRLGLGDKLHLPGPVRPVGRALAAMNVFLLASRFEGLPNVTLEAALAGLPVVTTDAGGAPETVIDGETGIVVAGSGADEAALADRLAEAVCTMLADPSWSERARNLGPAFVRDAFGIERMAEETLRLYGPAGEPT